MKLDHVMLAEKIWWAIDNVGCPDFQELLDFLERERTMHMNFFSMLFGAHHPLVKYMLARRERSIQPYLDTTRRLLAQWQVESRKVHLDFDRILRNLLASEFRVGIMASVARALENLHSDEKFDENFWTTIRFFDQNGNCYEVKLNKQLVADLKLKHAVISSVAHKDPRVPWVYLLPEPERNYEKWRSGKGFDNLSRLWTERDRIGFSSRAASQLESLAFIFLMPSDHWHMAMPIPSDGRTSISICDLKDFALPELFDRSVVPKVEHELDHLAVFKAYGEYSPSLILSDVLALSNERKRDPIRSIFRLYRHWRYWRKYLTPYVQSIEKGPQPIGTIHFEKFSWDMFLRIANALPEEKILRVIEAIPKAFGY